MSGLDDFKPCVVVNEDARITEVVIEDAAYVAVPVFEGVHHYMDKHVAMDDGRLVGFAVWQTKPSASATPADVGEEPVAWGVFRDGKMVAWVPGGGTEFKLPEDTDERRPLYSATALERVVRDRDEIEAEYQESLQKEYERAETHRLARRDAEAKLAEARKVDEAAFDAWWRSSKYRQVIYADNSMRQVALDGWNAAAHRFLEETK